MPSTTPTPTNAELAVLRVLWQRGPSTVREVHDTLADTRSVAYTTTLKTLQVMTAKGLTVREERGPQHLYRARHPESRMQRRLVRDLLDRAFGGSTAQLVLQALASRKASPEELQEIRRLIAAEEEKHHD
ncbi:MAG: BlaI/MecI/CopY family transcriptional regulator [Acidobacteria bacterium]|nr:BlaI/MecI/CopY family transcriptional regulator [Acidobacteriota bacterium]